MYCYKKEELAAEYPKLHSAVVLCELMGYVWKSIYMDKSNELAIEFEGKLSEADVRNIKMHFMDLIDGECDFSHITTEYAQDYLYHHNDDGYTTEVYTPDGYDYKNFTKSVEESEEEYEPMFLFDQEDDISLDDYEKF